MLVIDSFLVALLLLSLLAATRIVIPFNSSAFQEELFADVCFNASTAGLNEPPQSQLNLTIDKIDIANMSSIDDLAQILKTYDGGILCAQDTFLMTFLNNIEDLSFLFSPLSIDPKFRDDYSSKAIFTMAAASDYILAIFQYHKSITKNIRNVTFIYPTQGIGLGLVNAALLSTQITNADLLAASYDPVTYENDFDFEVGDQAIIIYQTDNEVLEMFRQMAPDAVIYPIGFNVFNTSSNYTRFSQLNVSSNYLNINPTINLSAPFSDIYCLTVSSNRLFARAENSTIDSLPSFLRNRFNSQNPAGPARYVIRSTPFTFVGTFSQVAATLYSNSPANYFYTINTFGSYSQFLKTTNVLPVLLYHNSTYSIKTYLQTANLFTDSIINTLLTVPVTVVNATPPTNMTLEDYILYVINTESTIALMGLDGTNVTNEVMQTAAKNDTVFLFWGSNSIKGNFEGTILYRFTLDTISYYSAVAHYLNEINVKPGKILVVADPSCAECQFMLSDINLAGYLNGFELTTDGNDHTVRAVLAAPGSSSPHEYLNSVLSNYSDIGHIFSTTFNISVYNGSSTNNFDYTTDANSNDIVFISSVTSPLQATNSPVAQFYNLFYENMEGVPSSSLNFEIFQAGYILNTLAGSACSSLSLSLCRESVIASTKQSQVYSFTSIPAGGVQEGCSIAAKTVFFYNGRVNGDRLDASSSNLPQSLVFSSCSYIIPSPPPINEKISEAAIAAIVVASVIAVLLVGLIYFLLAFIRRGTKKIAKESETLDYRLAMGDMRLNQAKVDLNVALVKQQEAVSQREVFIRGLTHRFLTPLNQISNALALIEASNESDRDIKQLMLDSLECLKSYLDQVIVSEHLLTEVIIPNNKTVSLAALLSSAVEVASAQCHKRGVAVEYFIDLDAPIFIKSDPDLLRHVLLNFISNSSKFTSTGIVYIHVSKTKIPPIEPITEFHYEPRYPQFFRNEDYIPSFLHEPVTVPDTTNTPTFYSPQLEPKPSITISVADTGIGISEENRNRLFKTFSQATADTTQKYGGSGLGLVITEKIIHALGGSIFYESVEGKGSVFGANIKCDFIGPRDIITQSDYNTVLVYDSTPVLSVALPIISLLSKAGINYEVYVPPDIADDFLQLDLTKHSLPFYKESKSTEWAKVRTCNPVGPYLCVYRCRPHKFDKNAVIAEYGDKVVFIESIKLNEQPGSDPIIRKPFTVTKLRTLLHENGTVYDISSFTTYKGGYYLVVDDSDLNAKLLKKVLEKKLGITNILLASNGAEAVRIVQKTSTIVCILMDIMMPVMDGIQATRLILENNFQGKIIAVTTDEKVISQYSIYGFHGAIKKPVNVDALKTLLS